MEADSSTLTPMAVLGGGMHVSSAVRVREIGTESDGLATPRDLAFNPEAPHQLWVVNEAADSTTIFLHTGTAEQTSDTRAGLGNYHFLSKPSSLAFGAPGMFATAHEQDQPTQRTTPADFMGPTLWTSDLDIFDSGHASHLDMLHNSPNAVGIAWERDNVYWVVDGAHQGLTRYDFNEPHELGGEDHSDGEALRYVPGELAYVPGVSSHAEFDHASGKVYVADTGHGRIAVLDPSGATRGGTFGPNYDYGRRYRMQGATLSTFVDGEAIGMRQPSGLALVGDTFYVTDHETSRVFAFDRSGRLLDWLDLSDVVPARSLGGITLDGQGRIYLTDSVRHRVLEISARQ
jgi:DNA-binding beta-propeller fold protein YncE